MSDALLCAACGASVPSARGRCGRCGGRTKEAPASPAAQSGSRSITFAAIGGALAVGALAIAMLSRSPEPVSPGPQQAVTPATPAQPVAPAAGESAAPVYAVAGIDASREGVASYNAGDVASAVGRFTAAVEADPNNADALNNLGQVLVRSGRAREAVPYFDRAIAITDSVWSYHFNRARAYGELKEWRQAVVGYTDAARLFPDDYITQFNLAKARQADGDLQGAIQVYAKATELAPGQADFHLWYGQALDLGGKAREAVAAYRRFLELDPNAAQAEKVKARLAQLG